MKVYLITGPGFHVGPGATLLLLEEQVPDRRHGVEDVRFAGGCALARTLQVQNFVAGELLGMTEIPIGMAGLVATVTEGEPETAAARLLEGIRAFDDVARKDAKAARRAAKAALVADAEAAAKAADEADERRWIEEWQAVELVRQHHEGDLKRFLAAKREERAAMAAAEQERARIRAEEAAASASATQTPPAA